jgi:hypothetical protein
MSVLVIKNIGKFLAKKNPHLFRGEGKIGKLNTSKLLP